MKMISIQDQTENLSIISRAFYLCAAGLLFTIPKNTKYTQTRKILWNIYIHTQNKTVFKKKWIQHRELMPDSAPRAENSAVRENFLSLPGKVRVFRRKIPRFIRKEFSPLRMLLIRLHFAVEFGRVFPLWSLRVVRSSLYCISAA